MAADKHLYVAFLWHMHQPYYKDPITGEYLLPWTRLHAVKDYYDMPAVLEEFPDISMTFNLVPSLLIQLEDYGNAETTDPFLKVTLKKAGSLDIEDQIFILKNFFSLNYEHMLKPLPKYLELLNKRGNDLSREGLLKRAKVFSTQDFLDLQVLYNLAWSGTTLRNDKEARALYDKKNRYTEDDKKLILVKQRDLIKATIPLYKKLMDGGQIELTTTPFYHPILPLVCNTESARLALPKVSLPAIEFKHPGDGKRQIEQAIRKHNLYFGQDPQGMWPAEGSVSEESVSLLAGTPIRWIATDQDILLHSLNRIQPREKSKAILKPEQLYKTYKFRAGDKEVAIFFRDRILSDLIGFNYAKWNQKDAADDFIERLLNIKKSLPKDEKNYIVSIILDGENAWEHYADNGINFFERLYDSLSHESQLKTTTFSEFLNEDPQLDKISYLHAGSWINHNFATWIGHEEKNTAWEYIAKAREELVRITKGEKAPVAEIIEKAWEEIYIAEGSDWFWWLGDDHHSDYENEFDELFRKHLKNIYTLIGKNHPRHLDFPIRKYKRKLLYRPPRGLIAPTVDGKSANFFDWTSAGIYDPREHLSAMHKSEFLLNKLYFGFDMENLYIRMEIPKIAEQNGLGDFGFTVELRRPNNIIFDLSRRNHNHLCLEKRVDNKMKKELNSFSVESVIEFAIPFCQIEVKVGDEVEFIVWILENDRKIESVPIDEGVISFNVPSEDFGQDDWIV